ncbi:MAG: hypothetical protein CL846_01190 [Crocinitomicaceae bacterium]|nr:hypothetical protein [Crocinitomicaceae bacterium]|tara:strand:- start:591 stop:2399 length:1809 start_codon:yes stop_codon:yes gene_type:complete
MKKIIYIFLFLFPVLIFSQDFNISSYVNKNELFENEYIKFTIESNQNLELRSLRFSDFNIVQGPFTSESHQSTYINGKISSKDEYKSTFTLSPKKTGTLSIPPIDVTYNNKKYSTNLINIKVKEGRQNSNVNPNIQRNNKPSQQNRTINNRNKNLFAKISASKSKPYLGESLLLSYKIYQSIYNSSSIQITDYDLPMISDFWTEIIDPPNGKQWSQNREDINGVRYLVYTLKKEIVFPQKSEKIKIPAFEVTALINKNPFSFFNSREEKIIIKSNELTIDVKSLPSNAPSSFKGQVGKNYKLSVNLSKDEMFVNDALDFDLSISGNGNLKELKLPNIDIPKDIEKYPAETKNKLKITTSGISGSKSLHHLLIPRFHGEYEIPAIEFTYFDIIKKKYITLSEESRIIKVNKNGDLNTNSENNNYQTIPDKEDVELINQNIRHIKENSTMYENKKPLFGSFKYWLIITIIPILLLLILLIINNKDRFKNQERIASKKIKKEVLSKFKNAENHLNTGNTNAFYNELYNGWLIYISDKLKINKANLNKENILKSLEKKKFSNELIANLTNILNECEMAQYSPIDKQDAKKTLSFSRDVITKFENHG